MVVTVIVVRPVAIILAVHLVVLLIVTDEVLQGHTVMACDEIDTVQGFLARVLVYVGTPAYPAGKEPVMPESPLQKRRTSSLYCPFHSTRADGERAYLVCPAASHASAISLVCLRMGSSDISSSRGGFFMICPS